MKPCSSLNDWGQLSRAALVCESFKLVPDTHELAVRTHCDSALLQMPAFKAGRMFEVSHHSRLRSSGSGFGERHWSRSSSRSKLTIHYDYILAATRMLFSTVVCTLTALRASWRTWSRKLSTFLFGSSGFSHARCEDADCEQH